MVAIPTHISSRIAASNAIRERILSVEAGLDERTLADTLEGLTDLDETIAEIVRAALTDEAYAEGLKRHIALMQERLSRLLARANGRREIARDAMLDADLKTLRAPDFTVSIRPGGPGLVVIDEKAVPSRYWLEREPRLDRAGLLSDLKQGAVVAGVALSNPSPVLSVRVR